MKKNCYLTTIITGAVMIFSQCISFTSTGLANLEEQPKPDWIGKEYDELINVYGAPRIVRHKINRQSVAKQDTQQPEIESQKQARTFLAVYKSLESSTWIVYNTLKEYSYTFKVEKDQITDFTKILSKKSNGISFSLSTPGIGSATNNPEENSKN